MMIEYETAYKTAAKTSFKNLKKPFFTLTDKERMIFEENLILYSMVSFLEFFWVKKLLKNKGGERIRPQIGPRAIFES